MSNCILLVKNKQTSIVYTSKFLYFDDVKNWVFGNTDCYENNLQFLNYQFKWHSQVIIYNNTTERVNENISAFTRLGDAVYGNFIVCKLGKNLKYWIHDLRALDSKEMAKAVLSQLSFKHGVIYELE